MNPLINTTELEDRLADVVVFDIRWALTDPDHGRNVYRKGHIPGAVFVDLDRDLASEPGPGRHPLPSVIEFAKTLGQLGLSPDDEAIVYDDSGNTVSARMWWMLNAIGHSNIRVLDGGYQAWINEGLAIATGDERRKTTVYPAPDSYEGTVEHTELQDRFLIDARAPERYRGDYEPIDPKAGHIPGAHNLPTTDNLTEQGLFRSVGDLKERLDLGGQEPVVYCGSGVNACHTALAMAVAGFNLPDVYVGSFSEWSRLDFPVNTGDTP